MSCLHLDDIIFPSLVNFFLFQSNNFCIWSCELLNKAKVNRLLFVDYLVAIDLAARELTSLQLLDKPHGQILHARR